jgi:hypothetical protein
VQRDPSAPLHNLNVTVGELMDHPDQWQIALGAMVRPLPLHAGASYHCRMTQSPMLAAFGAGISQKHALYAAGSHGGTHIWMRNQRDCPDQLRDGVWTLIMTR